MYHVSAQGVDERMINADYCYFYYYYYYYYIGGAYATGRRGCEGLGWGVGWGVAVVGWGMTSTSTVTQLLISDNSLLL